MPVELDEDSTKQRRELQQDDSSQIDDDYLESGVKIAVIDAEEGKPGTPDKILFTHTLYTVKVNVNSFSFSHFISFHFFFFFFKKRKI